MPEVKPLDRISAKWIRVSGVSQDEYTTGVRNPRRDWADETAKAKGSYEKGVQQAIQQDRFAKGVQAAGTQKWQNAAVGKGPARWAEGIRLGQSNYERGFAPYRQVIENTELPARGPVGDPQNIRRVEVLAKNLHEAKLRNLGG